MVTEYYYHAQRIKNCTQVIVKATLFIQAAGFILSKLINILLSIYKYRLQDGQKYYKWDPAKVDHA